jgi:hypothetical protein
MGDVYVGGRKAVVGGRHAGETAIFERFRRALARLSGS